MRVWGCYPAPIRTEARCWLAPSTTRGGIVSAGPYFWLCAASLKAFAHCLEPWLDPVPASAVDGAEVRRQNPPAPEPEPVHVQAQEQATAPALLSPMEALHSLLNLRRHSIQDHLEIGFLLHKEKERLAHGEFGGYLARMGVESSFARRCMAAYTWAGEFEGIQLHAYSFSKLEALLSLGYARLRELERTGRMGGLKLEDVPNMTVRELRRTVKKVKAGDNPEYLALLANLKATDAPH